MDKNLTDEQTVVKTGKIKKHTHKSEESKKSLATYEKSMFDLKKLACSFYQAKNEQLQLNLDNTKNFLNMVIHDFRNPTHQFEFAVTGAIKDLIVI